MSITFELLERMKIYTSIRIGKLMYSLNAVLNITFQLDMSPLFCIVVMFFLVWDLCHLSKIQFKVDLDMNLIN